MKKTINKLLSPFGVEMHGKGYIKAVSKSEFKNSAFLEQARMISGNDKPVIFDVGANVGDITKKYFSLFPRADIHCFEPFPSTFEKLTENFGKNPQTKLNRIALSENSENKIFYFNQNPDTNSLLAPIKAGLSSDKQVENKGKIEVACQTLDNYCKDASISFIDILKMDVQGAELGILKGATNLLTKRAIKVIYTESYFIQQYKDQPLFHDISAFLYQYGFVIQDLYSPIYGNNRLAWCDAIFERVHV